ncbi:MAG: EFR1 family ferrodoxin [Bacteroidales bacterium]|nr:EFR1 family ferrodoxin [Bacteroidales bacterium]
MNNNRGKQKYDKLIVYYFSGTGNAKNAAKWIAQFATNNGISSIVVSIDNKPLIEIQDESKKTLIGFCFPTHGFNVSPKMLKFIAGFPRKLNSDVFILNTRAGMKLSKLFIPGLSGIAQFLPALILLTKSYRIVGMQPLDLPSNWISLHPGLRPKVVKSIYERCEKITYRFAEKLLNGKHVYKAFYSLPFDILISPISVLYYFIGRFVLAKTFIANNDCTSCDLCANNCPTNSIEMYNGKPFWKFTCESCMRCMNNCPKRAIQTAHLYSFFIWYIFGGLVTGIAFNYFFNKNFSTHFLPTGVFKILIYDIFQIISVFVGIYFAYKLLNFLLRYKIFNKFINYTSLTYYSFWRRYKPPKNF